MPYNAPAATSESVVIPSMTKFKRPARGLPVPLWNGIGRIVAPHGDDMKDHRGAVEALIAELEDGGARLLCRSRYPQVIGDSEEEVVSEVVLHHEDDTFLRIAETVTTSKDGGVESRREVERWDERTLRTLLLELPSFRRSLEIPPPKLGYALDHSVQRMRDSHVFRSGGCDSTWRGTEAGEESMWLEDGAYVLKVRQTHTPPGGSEEVIRDKVERFDEAELRARAAAPDWIIKRVLNLHDVLD